MKPLVLTTLTITLLLTACSNSEHEKQQVDVKAYQVQNAEELQFRFDQLNNQLALDFKRFKKDEHIAFAHQYPLDTNDLKTLNMHLVASTSLKPTKISYCELMNRYFTNMYRLGHYNVMLLDDIKLPRAENENLKNNFENPENFYDFIINRYTTYKQVQQIMGYGCNLKKALN